MTSPHYTEIQRDGITDSHLLAIARCVLAWGQCEGHLRALLTGLEGRPLTDGAVEYFSLSPEDAWKRIKKKLREMGATEHVLEVIQSNREGSRPFYETRKLLVHAGCVGVWQKDDTYLVFSPFEKHSDEEMALYWVPLDDIYRSTTFAEATSKLANKILKDFGY